jgi:hypothetical protein
MTAPEPQIPSLIALKDIKDKPALRDQLEEWSKLYSLKRIIVSHGDIIEREPSRVLHELAKELAA